MTKIVFMGTPAFSAPILRALVEQGYDVQAVVTQPDRPVGRKKVLTPTPVKEEALKHSIQVLQPENLKDSAEMAILKELAPDLIVTAAFGQFLSEEVLAIPKHGCINVHASLLPKYRGGAPVHYAIMKGEQETGVTIMYMVKKMDAGDIISSRSIPITKQDDVGSMFDKLSDLGRDLLIETLPALLAGDITPIKQDETQVTYSPNISREQEQISWDMTAQEIDNMVRGLRPWPVAYTLLFNERIKMWAVYPLTEQTTQKSGTIIELCKESFKVAAGQGTVLEILSLQPAGKGKLTAGDYLRGVGNKLQVGDRFNDESGK
ncbi:methionyl-tRNA formyltransferase [Isobaculum melis]|uniref:Methionyl-tRNA formyltransferase n=1 Tax=Isobaculum melis TaxID=142588 RepID=A0A1H9RC32_9LACT|nr:methionyl-tRNA formyltransferase [Isobaculum melis]SER69599.1 methionyl-tRNA formyltransferase [Isobaculum melis]